MQLLNEWRARIGFYDQTYPERTKAAFPSTRQELAGLLDLTNRWTFAVIYGALGAVIFSLSRHLNAVISSPPLESTILRVLFAMFIAISVSMIFIPSSAFSVGNEISPTFVFLVCFVFGYSIDSFLRLLRRVDAWVSEKSVCWKQGAVGQLTECSQRSGGRGMGGHASWRESTHSPRLAASAANALSARRRWVWSVAVPIEIQRFLLTKINAPAGSA